MLLLGAVRPRMLRGTTLDARRRPCKLLVGGEVPATCHAKACALGVQQLELAFLLVPRHCPALSHPPKAQSQNICSWGLHKEALIDLGPLRGTTAPRPPGQLLPCRVEKGLCFVSLPCFPSRAEGQCGSRCEPGRCQVYGILISFRTKRPPQEGPGKHFLQKG